MNEASASTGRPEISVIIAAYDQGEWLQRCIGSVLGQTVQSIEIIVVDDCSNDDTAAVMEDIARSDPRIVYLKTATNSGPSVARHLGFQTASSTFITTLDADDIYLSPLKLEAELKLTRTRSKPERPAIGYSRYIVLDPQLKPYPKTQQSSAPFPEGDITASIFSRSAHIPRDFVMPKELYFEAGGYDPDIPLYEDWDLKLRLAAKADFIKTDLDGTGYVQHEGGLSRALPSEHETWLGAVFRKNIGLLSEDLQPKARAEFKAFMNKHRWRAKLNDAPDLSERKRLGEELIFLISMPRSGSTLTQRMLAAHPAIHSRSESWLLLQPLLARETDMIWGAYNHELAVKALDDFVDHLPNGEADYRHWLRSYYAGLYGEAMRASGARFHLDKTPRYHLIWSELMTLFPRARFILLWRHPLAVLNSMLEVMDYDEQRMEFWRIDLQRGLDNLLAFRDSGRVLEIVYEDLIVEPKTTLRRITDHIQLPFEPAMLDLTGGWTGANATLGDQKQASTTDSLDTSRLNSWRQAIAERPKFASLADAYLRVHEQALRRSPYDYEEMRALVPRISDRQAYALMTTSGGIKRPLRLRSKTDIARADRWQTRLARIGPLPYALGRFVWRTYQSIRS